MAGIPTQNILQPGGVTMPDGVNRALVSSLQLLAPEYWQDYIEVYGDEDYFTWLSTFSQREKVEQREFFWFENRGKNMFAVSTLNDINGAAGATVSITINSGYFSSGTLNPVRVGESFFVASSNVEAKILTVDTTNPNAFVVTARPKISTESIVMPAGDYLLLAGDTDAGEAADSIDPQVHLDIRRTNTTTEIRESWSATDRAEMTKVFYTGGFAGSAPVGGQQAGSSMFTYKGLVKANQRFMNHRAFKLMRGNIQNNTGLTNSVGTEGLIGAIENRGETITYTPGSFGIPKMHEITRIMDVNGAAKTNLFLMDIYLRQDFSDGIFKEFPAGAWVWGKNENSEEAAISYGVKSMDIDGYRLMAKKYSPFNSEKTYGVTPNIDRFRNFGLILPQGETLDARTSKRYKNITMVYEAPPEGGTIGNGIRVWQWGGGSRNPTDGKMVDNIEMQSYEGLRCAAMNQAFIVEAS